MSSTINASTASGGGVVTTADASGILALQTAGTTAVTIDGSQNVGIGTSSPSSKLDVFGGYISTANAQLAVGNVLTTTASLVAGNWYRIATFPSTNQGQAAEIHIRHGGTHNNTIIKVSKGTGQWRAEVYRAGYYISPITNPNYPSINKVRVYDLGVNNITHIDVQILGNTLSQVYNVIVKNNISDSAASKLTLVALTDQGTTAVGVEFQSIGTMASWGNNNGQLVTFDESGNVGIGTSSPATKLDVAGTINSSISLSTSNTTTSGNPLLISSGQTGTTVRSNSVARFQTTAAGRDVYIQFSDNVSNATEIGMLSGAQYFCTGATERMRIDSSGQQSSTIVGFSGTYTEYKCRAWVNFNGTGTVAIRASGNVSSITDNGVGSYTVNFTLAMPDANYAPVITVGNVNGTAFRTHVLNFAAANTTSACSLQTVSSTLTSVADENNINVSIFR